MRSSHTALPTDQAADRCLKIFPLEESLLAGSVSPASDRLHVGGREDACCVLTFPHPPAVLLLVVDVDDVPGLDAQLVVHVGRVVVNSATLTCK